MCSCGSSTFQNIRTECGIRYGAGAHAESLGTERIARTPLCGGQWRCTRTPNNTVIVPNDIWGEYTSGIEERCKNIRLQRVVFTDNCKAFKDCRLTTSAFPISYYVKFKKTRKRNNYPYYSQYLSKRLYTK